MLAKMPFLRRKTRILARFRALLRENDAKKRHFCAYFALMNSQAFCHWRTPSFTRRGKAAQKIQLRAVRTSQQWS